MPPGLSFVSAGRRAMEAHRKANLRTRYWDWTARHGSLHYEKYCGTPPVNQLFGLRAALDMILEEGLDEGDALIMPHDGERSHPLLALIRTNIVLEMVEGGDRRPLHEQFSEVQHSLLVEDPRMLRNVNNPEDLERYLP